MSDTEGTGRKGGYRLEYSANNRSKCKGPKPCAGTPITKGDIRVGSLVDFRGHTSFSWRHWGCVTPKLITNMKEIFSEADELDGFEDLKDDDKEKIRRAWEDGHVDDADIPDSARKPAKDGDDDEDEDDEPSAKKGKGKKAAPADDGKGKFKFEYAASARSKCKQCHESIGKNFFRLGHEVDFRGNKTFAWSHWGCSATYLQRLKASYDSVDQVEGYSDLKDAEKEKAQRAYEDCDIPEEDRGIGEAVEGLEKEKKKAAPRKKKKAESDEDHGDEEDEEERPKKKVRKTKKADDDDEEDVKPKKKAAPAKKAPAPADKKKAAAPAKKPAAKAPPKKKKKAETDESAEDFGDELDNVSGDDDEEEEEEEPAQKKRKRPATTTKAKASSSKPAAKPAKPASKRASKPASKAKKAVELSEEEDDD